MRRVALVVLAVPTLLAAGWAVSRTDDESPSTRSTTAEPVAVAPAVATLTLVDSAELRAQRATAAAVAYVASTGRFLAMGPLQLREAVSELATADAADRLVSSLTDETARLRDRLGPDAARLVLVEAPITVDVTLTGDSTATVRVWSTVMVGAERIGAPRVTWRTTTVDVAATDAGWRVVSASSVPGPTPVGSDVEPAMWTEFAGVAAWMPAVGVAA